LTPEEEKYYETYFDLFLTDGWKQFVTEITDILNDHRIEDIKGVEHLAHIQGERSVLNRIASFEAGIRNSYDYILEASDAKET